MVKQKNATQTSMDPDKQRPLTAQIFIPRRLGPEAAAARTYGRRYLSLHSIYSPVDVQCNTYCCRKKNKNKKERNKRPITASCSTESADTYPPALNVSTDNLSPMYVCLSISQSMSCSALPLHCESLFAKAKARTGGLIPNAYLSTLVVRIISFLLFFQLLTVCAVLRPFRFSTSPLPSSLCTQSHMSHGYLSPNHPTGTQLPFLTHPSPHLNNRWLWCGGGCGARMLVAAQHRTSHRCTCNLSPPRSSNGGRNRKKHKNGTGKSKQLPVGPPGIQKHPSNYDIIRT
jgi:hypothetical protein